VDTLSPAGVVSDRLSEFGESRGDADRVVRVLLDVMPRRRDQLIKDGGVERAASVTTSLGTTFRVRSTRTKNRRAAAASRRAESRTSMTWPCWSIAR
jgi:hypothetical protein